MIQSVKLENFQSHKSTELDFHPGINVIVGISDHGKSAVLRGLLWAINNQPQGTAYISNWTKTKAGKLSSKDSTKVSVCRDNQTLVRYRNADINGYLLPDETKREALRTDVPEDVKEFFNIGSVNIQRQADPPFLINTATSGGEIARFFNTLVNLEDIDKAHTSIQSKNRENEKSLKKAKVDLEDKTEELSKYNGIDELLEEIEEGLKLQDEIEKLGLEAINLQNELDRTLEYTNIIKSLSGIEEALEVLKDAENINKGLIATAGTCGMLETSFSNALKHSKTLDNTKDLDSIKEDLDTLEALEKKHKEALDSYNVLFLSNKKLEDLKEVFSKTKDLDSINQELDYLEGLGSKIDKIETKKKVLNETFSTFSKLFIRNEDLKLIIEHKQGQIPDSCPECGQTIKD